jgi:hypothetical protein
MLRPGKRFTAYGAAALFVLACGSAAPARAESVEFSGYLYDDTARASFDIYAESEQLEVFFTSPAAADFHVRVLGQTGKELGDFALATGPVITLTGGGKFTLVVYSEKGGGGWTAYYEH